MTSPTEFLARRRGLGTGDNADTGASAEGVPPSREEAIERDAATGGDQSARTSGQPELADRAENSLDS